MIANTVKNATDSLASQRLIFRPAANGKMPLGHLDRTIQDNLIVSSPRYENFSSAIVEFLQNEDSLSRRDSLYVVLPITIIYVTIFFTGVIGNISTCVVIARNKSMHTATNYYLFSLAVSDLLLLISGLPPEMYYIWSHFPYVFGEAFCIISSFAAEISANATVLTITAFTVERYVAICHPFISHTMSKLSRAVKFIVVIWLLALCLAVPQAIQFGVIYDYHRNGTIILESARCSMKGNLIDHAFEISTMLFFVLPMTVITVLYILIAIKLRKSRTLTTAAKRNHLPVNLNHSDSGRSKTAAQRNVIRMLVAVVVAFFICWAPFHAQRLLAVYAQGSEKKPHHVLVIVYTILTYVSGVFYYLSTTINPLLYNIMSNKFREAFKSMLSKHCGRRLSSHKLSPRRPTYSSLSRCQRSTRRADDRQNSASISYSDENQKTLMRGNQIPNSTELDDHFCNKKDNSQLKASNTVVSNNCREYGKTFSRGSSNSSQTTAMMSISKGLNEGNNNSAAACVSECLLRISGPSKPISLGLLAERLRFGTKGLFAKQHRAIIEPQFTSEVATAITPRFRSQPSIDSANTISNSSLQDLDETEFTQIELAQYMGELNFDLVT
ncbi:pyrokinin-1 receptor-like isoform X2 [Prorops nasuta]|uniref:pyrokinin-1 receptor-like isoform X2 n=1 Tax=Prorops nasuta TaxID=863751 RepID=UPI0034CDBC6B